MTPAYNPHDILRQIDNEYIAEYTQRHGLFPDLDIPALKQTEMQPVYDAIMELDEKRREAVGFDLRRIDTMADKNRIQELYTAIAEAGGDIPEFRKKRCLYDKAMWALLHCPDLFEKVLLLSFTYTQGRHWQKFPYPEGFQAALDLQRRGALGAAISTYFQQRDGRGKYCQMEYHELNGNHYLIAYPSEYSRSDNEWLEDGRFARVIRQLAFLVIFVFRKNGAVVEIYAEEKLDVLRDLFTLWTKEILGRSDIAADQKRSYNLRPFHTRDHGIVFPPDSPVKALAVHKIRFVPLGSQITYTLEGDIADNRHAIYEEMDRKRLRVHYIRQIGLEATLQANDAEKEIIRKFSLTAKSCCLKHEDEAGAIRKFLKDAGIDTTL